MSKRGRTPILNDDKRRAACAILSKGGTLAEAAECLQCSVRTLQIEQRRNPQFGEQVREAKARALLTPYQIMRKAARSNWRAASWMIERADAERREREMMEMEYDDAPEVDDAPNEEPSLLDRLRAAAERRSRSSDDTPLEITPELERDLPKSAAFVRALRARSTS